MRSKTSSLITLFFTWVFLTLLLTSGCDSKVGKGIPVEDFFSLSERTNFKISPDGRYVSFISNDEQEQRQLFLLDMEQENPEPKELAITQQEISSYYWMSENELVLMSRNNDDRTVQAFTVQVHSEELKALIEPVKARIRMISPLKNDKGEILVALNERDSSTFDVYRLDTRTGKKALIFQNPGNVIHWYPDLQGKLHLALASDSIQETVLYRDVESQEFRPVLRNSFHTAVTPLGFVKGKTNVVYALSNLNRDKLSVVELDVNTGKELKVLFTHDEYDVNQGVYSKDLGEMMYVYYFSSKRERVFLNDSLRMIYQKLESHLPGYEYRVIDHASKNRKIVLQAFTDQDPGAYYFYDGDRDRLVELNRSNPALQAKDMSVMQAVTFQTRDGRTINGYLTLPKGAANKKTPMIVYPHGGPSERNVWGFSPEVQFFASRGYAVFQLNFRGSIGYGKEFWTAGFKEWGGKIQEDIADGVQWLIDEQIADPQRIGIYGSGFGGYSSLYGACFHSELYACAASYGGFTNLFTHLKEVPPHLKPYLQMYYEVIGNPETEAEKIRAMSPVFYTNRIKIPIFIAQGGRDTRSTVPESNQFVQKLRKNGIPVTYIVREEEGRYFRKEENLIDFYKNLGVFFDLHLKK